LLLGTLVIDDGPLGGLNLDRAFVLVAYRRLLAVYGLLCSSNTFSYSISLIIIASGFEESFLIEVTGLALILMPS
jgi:hypothetical protein